MSISKDEIKRIAGLAKLDFRDEAEVEMLRERLESIVDYAQMVQSVDTEGVSPTNQVTGLLNVYREDEVKPYPKEMREKMFSQVPVFRDGYVIVPNTITKLK